MKHYSILLCLLLALGAGSFTTAKAQVDVNDSLALVDLYNSTNGPGWFDHTNWLTTNSPSTWYGVLVFSGRVVGIDLRRNILSGTIPASIGNLSALTYLNLYDNQLSGEIPASIGNLRKLIYFMDLHDNQLSGEIPASIGNLFELQALNLFGNQLTGPIPSSIGKLIDLNQLYLNDNSLTGTIPFSIGNLVNLETLNLTNNQLSASIPSSIGKLTKLKILSLSLNQLSGKIPSSIGQLVNLGYLNLDQNQLTGPIPSSIGNLTDLVNLYLNNNQLSGSIPASIGKLPQLYKIYLNNNQLSGELPHSFNQLKSLFIFDVSHNQLTQSSNTKYLSNHPDDVIGYTNDNRFTFNGAEYIAQKFPRLVYAPQARIPIHQYGNTLAVYAGGTLSNNTYHWFKEGVTGSTTIQGDSTFSPTQDGKYYVTVTNAIATQLTLYSDTVDFTMSNSITANNRVSADAKTSKVKQVFQVFPNPANNILNVQVNGTVTILLTNSSGKVMLTKAINSKGELNVSTLANGVYYIQNKATGEVQKVVVAH